MIGRNAFCFFIALTLMTPLTTCNDGEPRIDRSSGPLAEQRFQWIAGRGIDLLSGPAVPIRAYIEARSDVDTMGNIDYAYPGFEQAVAADSVDGDQQIFVRNLRPDARDPVDKAPVGNDRFHVHCDRATTDTEWRSKTRTAHSPASRTSSPTTRASTLSC
jgi:hypothetical protein